MTGLFIGLVTHAQTGFPNSRGAEGLMAQLAGELEELGISTTTHVEDRDLAVGIPDLSTEKLAESQRYLLDVQRAWASYCSRGAIKLRLRQWVGGLRGSIEPATASQARRLLNIELAHLELISASLSTGADFILIVEDDADCSDIRALARDLHSLLTRPSAPYMAHVSTSFSPKELGIESLADSVARQWSNGGKEFRLKRPVTNTVCATVYRQDLLIGLHELWRAEPLLPVIPVDWRLNALLMRMHAKGLLPEGYSSLVYPSPIIQRSLHS